MAVCGGGRFGRITATEGNVQGQTERRDYSPLYSIENLLAAIMSLKSQGHYKRAAVYDHDVGNILTQKRRFHEEIPALSTCWNDGGRWKGVKNYQPEVMDASSTSFVLD